jgi:hypothetical protein
MLAVKKREEFRYSRIIARPPGPRVNTSTPQYFAHDPRVLKLKALRNGFPNRDFKVYRLSEYPRS